MHELVTPSTQDVLAFITSLVFGSGLGCLFVKYHIRNEAKAALTEELASMRDKITTIEHEYVQCRFCDMQYNSVHSLLDSMDSKLNILLSQQIKN